MDGWPDMRFGKAILEKRSTKDGLITILDTVSLGKVYTVDLDSIHQVKGFHLNTKEYWIRDFIDVYQDGQWEGELPIELLKIEEHTNRKDIIYN